MRLTKEEARAYYGYALTPKQLIEKAKKFYDDLTPEERDEEYIVYGNNIKFEKVEVERLTTGEFYMRCVNDIEKRYEEFKNRERIYNSSAVAPYDPRYKMDDFTESEKMVSFLYYLMDNGFSLAILYPEYPIEVIEMIFWSIPEVRKTPQERAASKITEEYTKYIKPGEKNVGGAELVKRRAKANPPQTSLTPDEIASFDRMSEKWLVRWCNFSTNWLWVAPCLLLCIVVNKGLISAIGLLLFMGIGEWYSWKVKEYCSVILPWYQQAGIMLERRMKL